MAVSDVTFNGLARLLGLVSGQHTSTRQKEAAKLGESLVTESLLVDRPALEVYQAWRAPDTIPRVFPDVERVEVLDDRHATWYVRGRAKGAPLSAWHVEITEDVPGERVAWRVLPGAGVEHDGQIRFEATPRGTGVTVRLRYQSTGTEVAALLGDVRADRVRRGLRNFKSQLEAGEIPTVEGQPRGSCGGRNPSRQGAE